MKKGTTVKESWVVINPSSFYHDAVLRKGWCKPDQYLVVGFLAWCKWFNTSRNFVEQVPPAPAFVGNTYEIAQTVCAELNKEGN